MPLPSRRKDFDVPAHQCSKCSVPGSQFLRVQVSHYLILWQSLDCAAGTGKTDTAVQIMHVLYANNPGQRVLLITHSNQALNDLFGKLLERDVHSREGPLPTDKWQQDLDRLELSAQRIKTPVSYASEAYTLREHIRLVRQAVQAKAAVAPV